MFHVEILSLENLTAKLIFRIWVFFSSSYDKFHLNGVKIGGLNQLEGQLTKMVECYYWMFSVSMYCVHSLEYYVSVV